MTVPFEPIAVVGRGCVLPDALSPAALWQNVLADRVSLTPAPVDRWRVPKSLVLGPGEEGIDRTYSDIGGYVVGFDAVFDAGGFLLAADRICDLDPLFQWVMHAGREALRESGYDVERDSAGLVLGNLSYPSGAMTRYAERVWLEAQPPVIREALAGLLDGPRPHPWNRFSSGLPAHVAARALGLGAGAFALDAACASSIYAIKLACDKLHDGEADLMLAGAVNCADDLFIHAGFAALSALSHCGRSRPFHRAADGLVPAEGAAVVALRRLRDALGDGQTVLGVIRGIGLSNDGRGRGLLVPAGEGQERAMRNAYAACQIDPRTVSLVECHATGTRVGDATEVQSMKAVFGDADIPIGSLKSNLGHLITAAGAAALLKVLAAIDAGVRPATLGADEPIDELAGSTLRLLRTAEPWEGRRRAAISAFGFGGNNAHMVIDASDSVEPATSITMPRASPQPVAVVALSARIGASNSAQELARLLFAGLPSREPCVRIDVEVDGLRFPPRDLEETLAQQLLMLEAARDAVAAVTLPRERTLVLVGMGCDPEVARHSVRWRARGCATGPLAEEFAAAFGRPLAAGGVIGCMPNIVANRINVQLDLAGPSFSVSAEEASGLVALDIAVRALASGEADAALVGAVDLSHEMVHQAALAEFGSECPPGDGAVAVVLKRLADARADADDVLAVIDRSGSRRPAVRFGEDGFETAELVGSAHAARGLIDFAAAVLSLRHRARPRIGVPAAPWLEAGEGGAEIVCDALEAPRVSVRLLAGDPVAWLERQPPTLHIYSGRDREGVIEALDAGRESDGGPAKLVIVAPDSEQSEREAAARWWLTRGGPQPAGTAFQPRNIEGELAFVFSGGAAAYPGMARELTLALPDRVAALEARCGPAAEMAGWVYRTGEPGHPLERLWATSFLSQLHAEITRGLLGLVPSATLGYSSGETNALFALGAWSDMEGLVEAVRESELFTRDVVGEMRAVRAAWRRAGVTGERWRSFTVNCSKEVVLSAVRGEPGVHLLAVNAPDVCVLGGEEAGCARVIARLGDASAAEIPFELAVHTPELECVREAWYRLHHRPTSDVAGVRFYTCATGGWYHASAEAAAEAITTQALQTIDFVKLVRRAWDDGVRVFVEHGPRGLCSGWIETILNGREHVSVALDVPDRPSIDQLGHAVAALVAAGVPLAWERLSATLDAATATATAPARESRTKMSLPAHPPPPRIQYADPPVEVMEPAPDFPPSLATTGSAPANGGASPARRPVSSALPPLVAAAADRHRRLTELHRDFLDTQAAAHERFMQLRKRSEELLFAASARARDNAGKRGPSFDRQQLEKLASGRISEVFGPLFAPQDGYPKQTRMPQPPLLLADRVTGIDAVAGSMGSGTIWTETDVGNDSWYLGPDGRMPSGLVIEAGQADLLLISWLGVDLLTHGTRAYRLLGCELTAHRDLPAPGDRLSYEIHIDGHATHGDVRLFFFHYDCRIDGRLLLTVRNGQAGFFTEQELEQSAGVLWDASEEAPVEGRVDPPAVRCAARSFDHEAVVAFAEGRPFDCFGPGFEPTRAHLRTPRIAGDKLLLLDRVTVFDPTGGPWRRGYVRAERAIAPDDWFFDGHFKNDPCMPGTLMFEGSLQAMGFYLAACGFTIERDGWRFEPVAERTITLRCRGQATPRNRKLVYEVFVRELTGGKQPVLVADVLGTVDGIKAFHGSSVALALVPDWPLSHWRQLGPPAIQETGEPVPAERLGGLVGHRELRSVARLEDGLPLDYGAMLACAWGRPTEAFGAAYSALEGGQRIPRLPGPPYHFMSRVTAVHGRQGAMESGCRVEAEYDVPDRAWYFEQTSSPKMPFCVLMEVALQPCGWLASYVRDTSTPELELCFRNLDGVGQLSGEVTSAVGRLRTVSELLSIAQIAETIIETFHVDCFADGRPVFSTDTSFGFFPRESLLVQPGLVTDEDSQADFLAPSNFVLALGSPGPMLRMLDRVTGYWPDGGQAGAGRIRAERDIDPGDWYFRSHFFQDPVQPGSLGMEAMIQLLREAMLLRGLGDREREPRFELMRGHSFTWKYRGQVVPTDRRIAVELELLELGDDERGRYAIGDAWLWVDGRRIYQAQGLTGRFIDGKPSPRPRTAARSKATAPVSATRAPAFDPLAVRDWWRERLGLRAEWPPEDLCLGLAERFLANVHYSDQAASAAVRGRGCMYVANHQVGVESLVFTLVASQLGDTITLALAKAEHRDSWAGRFQAETVSYPGVADPDLMVFVDRKDLAAVALAFQRLIAELQSGKSVLVHVEGTRSLAARSPVRELSLALLDTATAAGAPVVPIRFLGGLPVEPLPKRLEFPVGYARQDYVIGRPIEPDQLAALPSAARKELVIEAINTLGPPLEQEQPASPDPDFAARVAAWQDLTGATHTGAVMFEILRERPAPTPAIQTLLAGADRGGLKLDRTAESQWLRMLARQLFGPHGPEVV